ncbi:hypothetical protein [uncultured Pseudokineococcus sp.]|uniref:hypothetical protein n=1 Tax=uncultured Pseudokineococcus sp. TaxID=1642928 RepID=UPI00262B852E|nr:hypothetical protein [uncultured Pseudokineococcus sp.]
MSPVAPAPQEGVARRSPGALRPDHLVLAALLAVTLLQRLAVPAGGDQVPLVLPVVLGLLLVGLATGLVDLDPVTTRLYAVGVGALVVLTAVSWARGQAPSLTSLLFAVAIYAVAVVRPRLGRAGVERVLDRFAAVMVVAAVVGLAQTSGQYLGVPYRDWLAEVVPEPFLQQGYNTADPVAYGASLYRANGVVFLEPSFYATFLAVALLVVLRRGRGVVAAALLAAALVPTLAGNGVVVAGLGILVLALGPGRRRLGLLVLPAVGALAIAVVTPVGELFLRRATEISSPGTSSSLRLVEPYTVVVPAYLEAPGGLLLGNGAGSVTEVAGAPGVGVGLLTPILPKLLFEYGLVGAVLFLLFVLHVLAAGWRDAPWVPGLVVSYLVLNAALLQVVLALLTILMVRLVRPHVEDP